ncbi:MAG: DUF5752 family protein [Calditrichia bacterium]
MNETPSFEIKDCALIAIATGKRAQNLRELKEHMANVSVESIYYHFWGGLLRPRFDDPEFHNDFAVWAAHELHDKILAERLSVLDPVEYKDLNDLRLELIDIIEERLDELQVPPWSSRDRQFEFIRSQIVIFRTRQVIKSPAELSRLLPQMSRGTIFFHFIDARRRNDNAVDDFRNWLLSFGGEFNDLREEISKIDPYFGTLTQLRRELTVLFKDEFRGKD